MFICLFIGDYYSNFLSVLVIFDELKINLLGVFISRFKF